MATTNGKMITCDRCGKQVFIKYIGVGSTDGGFTTWDKFEPTPDGWDFVAVPKAFGNRYGNIQVCDECHALWDNIIIDKFLKGSLLEKMEQDG